MSAAVALVEEPKRILTRSSNDFGTPEVVLEPVRAMGPIALDPCSNEFSIVNARMAYSLADGADGLKLPWVGEEVRADGLVFMNCPYSVGNQAKWVKKAAWEAQQGAEIIGLLQSRTETNYFKRIWATAQAVCFWYGRIEYLGGDGPCRFASALPYWGPRPYLFAHHFSKHGKVELL